MDVILLAVLIMVPIFSWGAWCIRWERTGRSLIFGTVATGATLYFAAAFAIHANQDAWARSLVENEIAKIDGEGLSYSVEDAEQTRSRGIRMVYSMTQVSLPIMVAGWYSAVFLVGLVVGNVIATVLVVFNLGHDRHTAG